MATRWWRSTAGNSAIALDAGTAIRVPWGKVQRAETQTPYRPRAEGGIPIASSRRRETIAGEQGGDEGWKSNLTIARQLGAGCWDAMGATTLGCSFFFLLSFIFPSFAPFSNSRIFFFKVDGIMEPS